MVLPVLRAITASFQYSALILLLFQNVAVVSYLRINDLGYSYVLIILNLVS